MYHYPLVIHFVCPRAADPRAYGPRVGSTRSNKMYHSGTVIHLGITPRAQGVIPLITLILGDTSSIDKSLIWGV